VNDGWSGEDQDFTNDAASVTLTFSGFSSVACGIVGYEWGVGTSPFATDLLTFTPTGLVVDANDEGAGRAKVSCAIFKHTKIGLILRQSGRKIKNNDRGIILSENAIACFFCLCHLAVHVAAVMPIGSL
jgi:hypothetical protein